MPEALLHDLDGCTARDQCAGEEVPQAVRVYALRRVGGAWAVWGPDPEAGDSFASRLLYAGPWHRIKERLDVIENGEWKGRQR
jgi:hypothetical protein